MPEKIFQIASWGKYIYRAEVERLNYNNSVQTDDSGIKFFIYSSQWLASLYVVVEGWLSLNEHDERIDILLSTYDDYVLMIKRCRNAVYHYQKNILDNRVETAVSDKEIFIWAGALLDEFIRFLYSYPFQIDGINKESLHLQKEYLSLIGWFPSNIGWVEWFETASIIAQYYEGENVELLPRSPDNDEKIHRIITTLNNVNPNPYIQYLSRIKNDA